MASLITMLLPSTKVDAPSTSAPVGLNKPGTNAFSLQHLQVLRQGRVTLHPTANDRWQHQRGTSRAHVACHLPLCVTCTLSTREGMRAAGVNIRACTHTHTDARWLRLPLPAHPSPVQRHDTDPESVSSVRSA